ncbi:unnamed protein product, partial [Anisakis simplex]|uniref:Uncharacterized protein n=1 Tax=Anisakis simplex TaxID=6269 RepID=A0A0M3J6Y4_ANISI
MARNAEKRSSAPLAGKTNCDGPLDLAPPKRIKFMIDELLLDAKQQQQQQRIVNSLSNDNDRDSDDDSDNN